MKNISMRWPQKKGIKKQERERWDKKREPIGLNFGKERGAKRAKLKGNKTGLLSGTHF